MSNSGLDGDSERRVTDQPTVQPKRVRASVIAPGDRLAERAVLDLQDNTRPHRSSACDAVHPGTCQPDERRTAGGLPSEKVLSVAREVEVGGPAGLA